MKRIEHESCCKQKSIYLILSKKIDKHLVEFLAKNGFIEYKSFTNSNICYVYDKDIIVQGSFGSDKLQVKCKTSSCNQSLNILESLIKGLHGEGST